MSVDQLLQELERQALTEGNQVGVNVELVTPGKAARWLVRNVNNRRLNEKMVDRLARDIQESRWVFNGESIKFDKTGKLVDGQHRLAAVVKAQRAAPMLVVTNLDELAQQTVDIGATRTVGQIAAMAGVNNSNAKAALSVALIRYTKHPDRVWTSSVMPSKTEQLNYILLHNLNMTDAVADGDSVNRVLRVNKTAYSAAAFLIHQAGVDRAAWLEFHNRVAFGANLTFGDPRFTLRNQLLRGERPNTTWQTQQQLALIIKAWNAHRNGQQVKALRFTDRNLPMPQVIN